MMAHVPRTKRAVQTLAKCDPQFREFVELVYGGTLDPEEVWKDAFGPVAKDNPAPPDVNAHQANTKRRLAIAGTVIGAGLGIRELGEGATQLMRGGGEALKPGLLTRTGAKVAPKALAAVQNNTRAVGALRTAGAGTMLGADLAATDELRKPKAGVGKRLVPIRKVGPSSLEDLTQGIVRGKLALHEQNPVGQGILGRLGAKGQQAAGDTKAGFTGARNPGTPEVQPGAAPSPQTAPQAGEAAGAHAPAPAPAPAAAAPAAGMPNAGASAGQQNAASYQVGQAGGHVANALLTPTGRKLMAAGGAAALAHHLMSEHDQGGGQPQYVDSYGQPVYKSHPRQAKGSDITWHGEISKLDNDKRLAFGYASVVSIGGVPVLDRQGDVISQEEIEKAAYDYVIKSRKGGDMHRRSFSVYGDDQPHHVSDLVESFVITDEKVAKMGLPDDTPRGWWVGFKVHDEDTWQLVKKGERTGFSIHGQGRRAPADMDELMGYAA